MARLKYCSWDRQNIEIALSIEKYANNDNLAIQMWSWENGYYEPWSMLTVNLDRKCEPDCAFVDVNNNGNAIVDFLRNNNLASYTGVFEFSGFCVYPQFRFDMDELKKYTMEDISEGLN